MQKVGLGGGAAGAGGNLGAGGAGWDRWKRWKRQLISLFKTSRLTPSCGTVRQAWISFERWTFLCLLWRNFFMRLIPVWEDESLVLQSYKRVKHNSTLKSKYRKTNFFNHKKRKKVRRREKENICRVTALVKGVKCDPPQVESAWKRK